jgi:endonuclease/exonuclease/phosphatase family metal-dependent hydrolase
MRFTTWNCYQGTDRKVPRLLDDLKPDIAIVPESAAHPAVAATSMLGPGIPHAWTGTHLTKGLGVFAPDAANLEVLGSTEDDGLQHGLLVRVELEAGPVHVLGVWTVPFAAGRWPSRYMRCLDALLARFDPFLSQGETILAGDLNCSAQSDPDSFPELLEEISQRYGLTSAYHHARGEPAGSESDMTLWWRGKRDAGFHCDLILVPEDWDVDAVTIGSYEEWGTGPNSSDHAPVTADLGRRAAR